MKRADPPSKTGGLRPGRATAASVKARAGRAPGRLPPTSPGRSYDDDELEFLQACVVYQKSYGVRFLAATDYLRIARQLGYRKVPGVGRPVERLDVTA